MILIDSDILMDSLKGRKEARDFILHKTAEGIRLATTAINVAEVLRGAERTPEQEKRRARDLLGGLTVLPFGPRAADRFGVLMAGLDVEGTPIPTVDGMIAAVALESAIPVVTRNIRHFGRVPDLVVRTL